MAPKPGETVASPRKRPGPERIQYWSRFYGGRDDGPLDLLETVLLLSQSGKFQEVEAALLGYMSHRDKDREAWMYEWLAVAMDYNQAGDDSVARALGYAAILALKGKGTPQSLVSIADLIFLRDLDGMKVPIDDGEFTVKLADLIDKAVEEFPHRAEPLIKSMDLARRDLDPERLGRSVEALLSLGWPGVDAEIRSESRKWVETMVKTLLEEGRSAEADTLQARLQEAEIRDLYIRLTWNGFADLDLEIEEPLGATAAYLSPRTVFGGTIIKNGRGKDAEEIYTAPRAFDGKYKVRIKTVVNDPKDPATDAKLEVIQHEGTAKETIESFPIDLTVADADREPIEFDLKGGRRQKVLPMAGPSALANEPEPTTPPRPRPPAASAPEPAGTPPRR